MRFKRGVIFSFILLITIMSVISQNLPPPPPVPSMGNDNQTDSEVRNKDYESNQTSSIDILNDSADTTDATGVIHDQETDSETFQDRASNEKGNIAQQEEYFFSESETGKEVNDTIFKNNFFFLYIFIIFFFLLILFFFFILFFYL